MMIAGKFLIGYHFYELAILLRPPGCTTVSTKVYEQTTPIFCHCTPYQTQTNFFLAILGQSWHKIMVYNLFTID